MISRGLARKQLGIPERACVLLTIAASHKYAVEHEPSMVDILDPVLERSQHCVLLAIGPRGVGEWAAAGQRHAGRVCAVGNQDDTSPFLAAADIYLDSFPTTSLTSLLEAGQAGLPLLRLQPSGLDGASPLLSDDPALLETLVTVTDADSYRDVITGWLSDANERARVGEAVRRSIEDTHGNEHWKGDVDAVYHQAVASRTSGAHFSNSPGSGTEYDLALVELHSSAGIDVYFVRRLFDHCALLAPRSAVMMAMRFLIAMRDDAPSIVVHRKRIWRWLRRVSRRNDGTTASTSPQQARSGR
jgi:hypothetical protein